MGEALKIDLNSVVNLKTFFDRNVLIFVVTFKGLGL